MMNDLVIIGAGGFGREVQWLIERINENCREQQDKRWHVCGYIDDGVEVGTDINGYKVLGGMDYLLGSSRPVSAVCAIGSSQVRRKVMEKVRDRKDLYFPNLVDPSVQVSDRIEMGIGNVLCAGSILTVNIELGDFCIINLDCTIGHDVRLGSYVTICPSTNISGGVQIGERSEIGTGAHIIQGKNIGRNTVVGAGAVVVQDIPDACTAVGVPCKPVKYHF